MKIQAIEDLKRSMRASKNNIENEPMPTGLKGAAISNEKARRKGYIECITDTLTELDKISN